MRRVCSRLLASASLFGLAAVALPQAQTTAAAPATIVSVSSTTSDGTYKVGDEIKISVNFSEVVTVTQLLDGGSPGLLLETGPTDRTAGPLDFNWSNGRMVEFVSSKVVFSYKVRVGDYSQDLDVQSDTAFLGGGFSFTSTGVEADLTLPKPGTPGSLSVSSDLRIDGSGADEQWQGPLAVVRGLHGFMLSEDRRENVSYLAPTDSPDQFGRPSKFCVSADSEICRGKDLEFRSVLPMCSNAVQIDCVANVRAESTSNGYEDGSFSSMFPARGNYDFTGSLAGRIPNGSTSTILRFPKFPHTTAGGLSEDKYLITVAVAGTNSANNASRSRSFFASVTPITYQATTCDERFNGRMGPEGVGLACMDGIDKGLMADNDAGIRCIANDAVDENKDGRITPSSETGDRAICALKQAFPEGVRFSLDVKLSDAPNGWLHGRLDDPQITFDTNKTETRVRITAGPVRVPVYAGVASYQELPRGLRDYFDTDLCKQGCSTRLPGGKASDPPNARTAFVDNPEAYSTEAFKQISLWKEFQRDTANALPSWWNVRTLSNAEMAASSSCLEKRTGVTGIVTTNATAYVKGPPSFDSKSKTLQYEVAAPHFEKDGKTEFKGVYNLIVREDVAECLYRFSNAFAAPAPPEEFADKSDPDVYVEEEPYTEEKFYAEEYPEFGEEYVDTDDGSYEMYEDVEYEEVSLEKYVDEEEDFTLTEDVSDSGAVIEEEEVFEETVVASIDASITTELQKAASANTAIELADGWFKFSATNFTFSKPTVKVNFAATPSKVLACVAGSTVRYVKSIRSQCPSGTSVAKTAYCVKGKAVDAIVGANPKCPKGAKVAKTLKCAKGDDARLVVALVPKCAKGWSKVNSYICVKGNIARRVSAVQVKCANGFGLAKQITCVKGRASTTVTAVKPACPKGYRARK